MRARRLVIAAQLARNIFGGDCRNLRGQRQRVIGHFDLLDFGAMLPLQNGALEFGAKRTA